MNNPIRQVPSQQSLVQSGMRRCDSGTVRDQNGRVLIATLIVLVALVGLAWWLTPRATGKGRKMGMGMMGGPIPVAVANAAAGDMPILINGLGTVTSLATVTVQSQVDGQITQIAFKEGQHVKPGDFLLQIDPRPYQVTLEQAEGTLKRDQALLANAKVDLARYEKLLSQDSIAEQDVATQRSLVAQDEGVVKTDQGAVDSARLNLHYAHVESPIEGRVGLQQVNVGNYVTSSTSTGLVVITQTKPISVIFTVAEDRIPALMNAQQAAQKAGHALTVSAYDRTHTQLLATGELTSIDNEVDTTTGTLKLKATFANADERLFPNQFVNVDLLLDTLHDATLVPQSAVLRGTPGTYVYVVNADQTVGVRKVTIGSGDANHIVITDGLKAGEQVVTDGTDKLRDGAQITLPDARPKEAANAHSAEAKPTESTGSTAPDAKAANPAASK